MRLSEWLMDVGLLKELRGGWCGGGGVRHVVVDGVLEGDVGEMGVQGVLGGLVGEGACRAFGRVSGFGRLVHVPKRVVWESDGSRLLSNYVERYGSLWRRVVMRVGLGDGGVWEMWRGRVGEMELEYEVEVRSGRMLMWGVEPEVWVGTRGVGCRWMEVQYYGLEVPEWGPGCQCELRMERPA